MRCRLRHPMHFPLLFPRRLPLRRTPYCPMPPPHRHNRMPDGAVATPQAPATAMHAEQIRIPVSGMTCAACQARVQRALQKSPGVLDASVNLMMQTAAVTFDSAVATPSSLVDVIRKTGYGAELARADETVLQEQQERDASNARRLCDAQAQGNRQWHCWRHCHGVFDADDCTRIDR